MEPDKTIHLFEIDVTKDVKCTNNEPVVDMMTCAGLCSSNHLNGKWRFTHIHYH